MGHEDGDGEARFFLQPVRSKLSMYRYHRPGRWRGRFFLPFIFIAFFASGGHGPFGILTWIVPIIIVLVLTSIIRERRSLSQQPYQNNQPPYYNQSTYSDQYYRPQQTYMPYQQGYRPAEQPRETYQEGERTYSSLQQEQYQEYEQPQAQYPEQLPPMQ
jgi:heme exporter protein D